MNYLIDCIKAGYTKSLKKFVADWWVNLLDAF